MKITCIVVTFNRANLLKECLESLINQSVKLDHIVVIDNASTDNTLEVVSSFKDVTYLGLKENTGGAGGFYTGMKYAVEKLNSDWVWVMDDDVEAYPSALESLLKYKNIAGCIHGKRTNKDGVVDPWESKFFPGLCYCLPMGDKSFKAGLQSVEVTYACFEGMLISSDVIKKIGYPDPRFFITWDDTAYGYLASKVTKVIYVNEKSLIRKRDLKAINVGFKTINETSDLYRYYHIRNRFLIKQYLKKHKDYNPVLFEGMTVLLLFKEYFRAIFFQKNWGAYRPILSGYRDGFKANFKIVSKEIL